MQKPFKNDLQGAPRWHLNHIPRTSTKLCENVLCNPKTKNPFCLCWLPSNPAYSLCDIFAEMLIFLCKFAFCSLLINFVVSLNISPVCQKAYSANSSCRHTFSYNKIISLFTKYFNKFRFQSECPIHTPASEVGEQSGIADLLIPFVRLFSLGQHGVITTLYKPKIWQHILLSLTGTAMTLTLKAETHNGQESPYLGILHLFHTWPLFCWSL